MPGKRKTRAPIGTTRKTSHPLPSGRLVVIIRTGHGTLPPFIEGMARIVRPVKFKPHCYEVKFVAESVNQRRLIFPEFQKAPERITDILRALWQAEATYACDIDIFF